MPKDIDKILKKETETVKRFYNKNQSIFNILDKIKLYVSRTGVLHGIKSININGQTATVTTHCGQTITVMNSKNSRIARWIRNRWLVEPCSKCKIPDWKLEKYSTTRFVKRRCR